MAIYKLSVYKKMSGLLAGVMLLMYGLRYSSVVSFVDRYLLNYTILPMMWIGIVMAVYRYVPKIHSQSKYRFQASVRAWAFNFGAIWIVGNLALGVILGFGKSPYSHAPKAILLNTLFIGGQLVGHEVVRTYWVNTFCRRQKASYIIVIIVMTLFILDYQKVMSLKTLKEWTMFGAQEIGPAVCTNILATYLVAYGGVKASIIYLGMKEAFEWLSPILPDIDWLIKGMVGMVVPMVSTLFLMRSYNRLAHMEKAYKMQEESIGKWLVTAVCSVLLVWFTVGVFPIYPSAVVTGSMQPLIDPGDVVIIRKVQSMEDLEALQIGDVIQFRRGDILINHRIWNIVTDGETEEVLYQTKGDNNSTVDAQLVSQQDVKGTIEHIIPKIGWPTLVLKSNNKADLIDIEF